MKFYKLSNKQLSMVIASLAAASVLSFLLGGRSETNEVMVDELSVPEKVVMPVQTPATVTNVRNDSVVSAATPAPKVEQQKIAYDTQVSNAWAMGGVKADTPKISLNEKIVSYGIVELNPHPEKFPAVGEQVQFPMLGGKSVVVNVESATENPNGDYTWSGHLQGYGTDFPVIMTYGAHLIFATVTTPEGSYTMESQDGLGWLYKNPAEVEMSAPGVKDYLEVQQ